LEYGFEEDKIETFIDLSFESEYNVCSIWRDNKI